MAEWSGPFDPTTDLTETRWRKLLSHYAPDGVRDSYGGGGLAVTVNANGVSVDVAAGNAVIQGGLYENTATVNKTDTTNAGGSARPDRVVLRYDPTANSISPVVREGTAGGSAPPGLVQVADTGQWDIPLARWSRAAGGGIGSLVDERQFITPDGLVVTPDGAITTAVPLTALVPSPRTGQRVLSLPSAREYRWSGTPYNFWERTDPADLLNVTSVNGGTVGAIAWTSDITGSAALSGSFTAPLSGRVSVFCAALISSLDATRSGWGTVRITGPSGFSNLSAAPNDDSANNISHYGLAYAVTANRWEVAGMTPGQNSTATFMHASSGGTVYMDLRRIIVRRA